MNRIKDFLKRFVLNYLGISSLIHYKKKSFFSNKLKRFKKNELFNNFDHREQHVNPNNFYDKVIYLLSDQKIDVKELKNAKRIESTEQLTDEEVSNGVFYICYLCDDDALPEVDRIQSCKGIYVPHLSFSKNDYRFIDKLALSSLKKTLFQYDRISHFNFNIHENICEALNITRNLEGDYVEIGVFKGGSALTALNYLDEQYKNNTLKIKRKAWLIDTFDGFNYEEAKDSSDIIWHGTHSFESPDYIIKYIQETLKDINTPYELIKSNICSDNLNNQITKIAVANLDVDMFEPTLDGLHKLSSKIVSGGIIICEDPPSTPALYGALLAMEKFLNTEEGKNYVKIFKGSQYFLLRK